MAKLGQLGYTTVFQKKGHMRSDGVLIGFKPGLLELYAEPEAVLYDFLMPNIPKSAFYQGYVGLIACLQVKGTNNVLIVGCTHLWAMHTDDIRYGQYCMLAYRMACLQKFYTSIGKNAAIVLSGDMNSLPGSETFCKFYLKPVYRAYLDPSVSTNITHFSRQYPIGVSLRSAYETYLQDETETEEGDEISKAIRGHPKFTNYRPHFKGCLDYILYDAK